MSLSVNELREYVRETLKNNDYDSAEAYLLWDESQEIKSMYPDKEVFKRYVRKQRAKMEPNYDPRSPKTIQAPEGSSQAIFSENRDGGATVEVRASNRIQTLEQLLASCKVDMEVWQVASYTVNSWEQNSVEEGITTLYQIKANLSRIKPLIPTLVPIQLPMLKRVYDYTGAGNTSKTLVIGDAQIGFNRHRDGTWETFHDRRAMDIILHILKEHRFETIILNGDFLDFAEASRYVQKPEFSGTFQPAINEFGYYLYKIRELAPTSEIIYLLGNHEIRLENSMIENLKFAYGLNAYGHSIELMSLRNILQLDAIDVECIKDYPKGSYWIGKNLRILHGEYTSVSKELNTSHTSVLFGHLHHIETQSKTTFFREGPKQVSVHTHGCLCKIDGTVPGMNSRPNWQQGFVVVDHFEDYTGVNHVQIDNGVCIYQGKKYEGKDLKVGGLIV